LATNDEPVSRFLLACTAELRGFVSFDRLNQALVRSFSPGNANAKKNSYARVTDLAWTLKPDRKTTTTKTLTIRQFQKAACEPPARLAGRIDCVNYDDFAGCTVFVQYPSILRSLRPVSRLAGGISSNVQSCTI